MVQEAVGLSEKWDELLTVEDVALLLKVPKSWVYERTRRRGEDRLPFVKLGKYVRFESRAIQAFLWPLSGSPRDIECHPPCVMPPPELSTEEPTRGKDSRMARTKRQYGSGCLLKRKGGWATRWRELEIAPDGTDAGAAI